MDTVVISSSSYSSSSSSSSSSSNSSSNSSSLNLRRLYKRFIDYGSSLHSCYIISLSETSNCQ